LIHAISYNNRLQPSEIKLGTSSNSASVMDITYSYGTTANNGNVLSASYSGGGLSNTQSYSYDELNRLAAATETTGSTTNWSQNNHYDRYGNRQIDYGGGSYNLAFSSSTNRITTNGYSYDSAGNLANDTVHSYGYDAANRIVKFDTSAVKYIYDGEGQRVAKRITGDNVSFVYGIGGALIAEFERGTSNIKKEYINGTSLVTIEPTADSSGGETPDSARTKYSTSDHLGSPRVITGSDASVLSRHDYMPFGGGIATSPCPFA
jgi:YD repeat-containing protein